MDDVFASIASGVITADLTNRIILCNRAAVSILGSLPENPAGHNLVELLPTEALQDQGEDLYQYIQQVGESGSQIVGVEINPVLPNRGPVMLSLNLSPLKDATQTTHGVAIVVDDLTEKKRLEAQRRLFERMVSPAVISQLNPDQLQLGGKRTKITTLFADIRGFTHFSEQFEPEKLVAVLNNYLAAAAEAVLAQEGTVDKFLGDAVMAWYNAPIPQPDHALRAVNTAIGIRDAVIDLNSKLPPENQLTFGVGIHFGDAVLGLVGTEKRLDYTAIGDSVNTAKRIQENSNPGQIVISETVYELVKDQIVARPIEPIIAKGKSHPVKVYEVIDLN
jgi:PAS domain S-box-containing protein